MATWCSACRGGSWYCPCRAAALELRMAWPVTTTNATATRPNIANSPRMTSNSTPRRAFGWLTFMIGLLAVKRAFALLIMMDVEC